MPDLQPKRIKKLEMSDFATRVALSTNDKRKGPFLSLSFPFPLVSPSNVLKHARTHAQGVQGSRGKRTTDVIDTWRESEYRGRCIPACRVWDWHSLRGTANGKRAAAWAGWAYRLRSRYANRFEACPRFQLRLVSERVELHRRNCKPNVVREPCNKLAGGSIDAGRSIGGIHFGQLSDWSTRWLILFWVLSTVHAQFFYSCLVLFHLKTLSQHSLYLLYLYIYIFYLRR